MEQIENSVGDTQQEPFNRPPRIWPPMPDGVVTFPTPPQEERETQPPTPLTLLLPMLSIAVLMGISITLSHGSFQQLAFLLPMAIFTIVNPLTSMLDARQKRKALRRKQAVQNKQFMEGITKTRAQLEQETTEQRRVALLIDPDPIDLEERVRQRAYLWERRPEDPDFLMVRVGKGRQPLTVKIEFPSQQKTSSPLTQELQQLKDDFAFVNDVPCSIPLTKVKSLGITGRRQDVKEFLLRARDLRFHIIVAGSPNDRARPDALLQQVRSCRIGIILGGDPTDLPLLGVRISDFPPGRGHLVRRNRRYLVQVAHAEPKEILSRITTDAFV